jgi:O-antigen/teichoic acid export membrane protein
VPEADSSTAIEATEPPRKKELGILGRALRNAGWLLGGKGVSGLFSLVYLALAARGLGVEGFGRFAMILSYGQAVANIVQFQSWQTVIRYGAHHLKEERFPELRRILAFTGTLDFSAASSGVIIAAVGAFIVGPHLGWSPADRLVAAVFGISLLFGVRGTPIGILRLFDRFDLSTYAESVLPTMRLIGAVAVYLTGPTIVKFLLVWAIADLLTSITVWWIAHGVVRRRAHAPSGAFLRGVTIENVGLWRFAWTTNITASINLIWQQLPVLAVGGSAGAGVAGGYRIASQVASALGKPTSLMTRAIYPEFARMAIDRPAKLGKVIRKATAVAAMVGICVVLVMLIGGKTILSIIGGHHYDFVYPMLILLTISVSIDFCSFALEPAMVAMGRPGSVLLAKAAVGLVYAPLLIAMLQFYGSIGAAMAAIFASTAIFLIMLYFTAKTLREHRGT